MPLGRGNPEYSSTLFSQPQGPNLNSSIHRARWNSRNPVPAFPLQSEKLHSFLISFSQAQKMRSETTKQLSQYSLWWGLCICVCSPVYLEFTLHFHQYFNKNARH